jgi:prevent-host-death family protein
MGFYWYDFRVKNQISQRGRVQRLTATEAARDFSKLLDRIEAGEEAIIERRSEPVAVISSATGAPRRISECIALKLARPSARLDDGFASDLMAVVSGQTAGEPPTWD